MRSAVLSFLILAIATGALAPSSRADDYRPFNHAWYGMRDLIDKKDNFAILGIGAALTIAAFYIDERADQYFAEHHYSVGGIRDVPALFKREMMPALIGAAELTYGQLMADSRGINAGQAHLEAIGMYTVTAGTLKFLTYRNGPGADTMRHAFPSGQFCFVTAGHMYKMYGLGWSLPFLAIGTLGLVDYEFRRVHWTTDLIFGSFLAFAMGSSFVDHHLNPEREIAAKGASLSVLPYYGQTAESGRVGGLALRVRY